MATMMLDIILVVILVGNALAGYRRGVIATFTSTAGFVVGAALGLGFIPGLLARYLPAGTWWWRPLLLVLGVLVCASICQSLCTRLAAPVTATVRRTPLHVINAMLGSALTVVLTAVGAWLIAGLVALAPAPALRDAVSSSRVLAAIEDLMPMRRSEVMGQLRVAIGDYQLPEVFAGGQAPDLGAVDEPDSNAVPSGAIAGAAASTYRIDAIAARCGRTQDGSGWALSTDQVVTNAHVVAGANDISIRANGVSHSAQIAIFDPNRDLAVLNVPGLNARPLTLGGDLSPGQSVVLAGYPLGGGFTAENGRVGMRLLATGTDIYNTSDVVRDIYAVRGRVQPGNSGGPALAADGTVRGVVFARSLDDAQTAYVLTLSELRATLADPSTKQPPQDTACAA